jgi:lysophospholipase L1-like esterase
MSTAWKLFRRLGRGVRAAWCFLGLTLVAMMAAEGALRLAFHIKDTWIGKPFTTWCDRIMNADTYQGARWIADYCEEHLGAQMEWHPYVYWRRRPFRAKYTNIDEQGIRRTWNRPLVSSVCDDHRFRIFVLGGSTIWGPAARDDHTVPSHLSRLLDEAGFCVEVLNLGETGYVSTQELIVLLRRVQRRDIPDLAIFYDGVNELFSAFQNQEAGIPQNEEHRRREFNSFRDLARLRAVYLSHVLTPEGVGRLRDAFHRGLRRSRPQESLHAVGKGRGPSRDELIAEALLVYKSNVELVQLLASHYGFDALFYWHPMILTKKNLTPYEREWYEDAVAEWRDFLLAGYERVEADVALNREDRFRYLGGLFDEVEAPYYVDAFHLTEDGNLLVAREIAKDVIRLLRGRQQAEPPRRGDDSSRAAAEAPSCACRDPSTSR